MTGSGRPTRQSSVNLILREIEHRLAKLEQYGSVGGTNYVPMPTPPPIPPAPIPPGGGGGGGGSLSKEWTPFEYTWSQPTLALTVAHGWGRLPAAVTVWDLTSSIVDCAVQALDYNTVQLTFEIPTAGKVVIY